MKYFKSNDGLMFPFALLLLAVVLFYVGSYSVRYTVKLNTLDNLKDYYYQQIISEIRSE